MYSLIKSQRKIYGDMHTWQKVRYYHVSHTLDLLMMYYICKIKKQNMTSTISYSMQLMASHRHKKIH